MTGRPEITPGYCPKTEWKTATEEPPPPNNKPKPETEGTADRKQNGTHLNQTNGRTDKQQEQDQKNNRRKNTQHRLKREDQYTTTAKEKTTSHIRTTPRTTQKSTSKLPPMTSYRLTRTTSQKSLRKRNTPVALKCTCGQMSTFMSDRLGLD